VRGGDFKMDAVNLIAIIGAIRTCISITLERCYETVDMCIFEELLLTMSFRKFGCGCILKLIS